MFRKLIDPGKLKPAQDTAFEYAQSYLTRTKRVLFLRGPITGYPYRTDFANPSAIGDDILAMGIESATEPIIVFIDSPGGEIFTGFNLYDIMLGSQAPLITIGQSVASMAVPIFLAGHKKYALPHSRFMLHLPQIMYIGKTMDTEEMRIQGKLLDDIKEELVNCYIERGVTAGLTEGATPSRIRKKILADIDREFWLTAKEAKDYGLIDSIISIQEIMS